MPERNNLNFYSGSDAIKDYFDPDTAPPLPLVELPETLNPYRDHGVRIYAKMMSMHPANNVKCMPALNLLEKSIAPGSTKTVVEYSSGSTVLSMSLIARAIHGLDDTKAFLSNKTSIAKIRLMQLFGIKITLFGGPSQPEPLDERGGIRAAQKMDSESPSVINPNQYENDNNWKAHVRWTGPQLLKQLPRINLICAGMGTSGTMTGLGTYFKDTKPSVFRLGVCTAPGDRVPGPRSYALLGPVNFPWKSSVDYVEEVGSYHSYDLSLQLCRQGLICGPSSGFNLQGLYQFLERRKTEGTLNRLAGPDGEVNCVFLCCDLPYQYVNEYFDKLHESSFPPIQNQELLDVDLYRYDEKWERDSLEILREFWHTDDEKLNDLSLQATQAKPCAISSLPSAIRARENVAVIDLRQASDFFASKLPGSINLPVAKSTVNGPFYDPQVLCEVWKVLEEEFKTPTAALKEAIEGRRVLLLCYDGDTSRVGASVMRAKGYEANSLRGGFSGLASMISSLRAHDSAAPQLPSPSWLELSQRNETDAAGASGAAASKLLNLHRPIMQA